MVSQTKNKLDVFQKCRFEKMDFPKFEKRALRGLLDCKTGFVQLTVHRELPASNGTFHTSICHNVTESWCCGTLSVDVRDRIAHRARRPLRR